jgi:ubiquinone/menaquinone biosynthesis C-methylase UbiE
MDPLEIRDRCRSGLIPYTLRAFSLISLPADPLILDIGCGSGVPTLALMNACAGRFVAVDPDPSCLERLRKKVRALPGGERVALIQASVLALPEFPAGFDLVVAEGSLHLVGFEAGMAVIVRLLKPGGHALVHEPLAGDRERRAFLDQAGMILLDACVLDDAVWWRAYFAPLERAIGESGDAAAFAEERREIAAFKNRPWESRSIYYVLKKSVGGGQ